MQRRIAIGALAMVLALSMGLSTRAAPIIGSLGLDFATYAPAPTNTQLITNLTSVTLTGPVVLGLSANTMGTSNPTGDYSGIPSAPPGMTATLVNVTSGAISLNFGTLSTGAITFDVGSGGAYGSFVSTGSGTITAIQSSPASDQFVNLQWTGTFTPGSSLPATLSANPFTVVGITLRISSNGNTASYTGSSTLASPVPEPGTVLSLLCGLPFLGLLGYRSLRRRSD